MRANPDTKISLKIPKPSLTALGAAALCIGAVLPSAACSSRLPCEAEIPLSKGNDFTTTTIHLPDNEALFATAIELSDDEVKLNVSKSPIGGSLVSAIMSRGTKTSSVEYPLDKKSDLHFQLKEESVLSHCSPIKQA